MDRKNFLKEMSATELKDALIGRLREQIRRNEEENESLREQVRQLSPGMKSVSANGVVRQSRTLSKNETPLREVIMQVLRESPEPLRVREVVKRVRSAGYSSKA